MSWVAAAQSLGGVGKVQVPLQNVVFGQALLQLDRDPRLAYLAARRALGRLHHLIGCPGPVPQGHTHILHGQRRGTLLHAAGVLVGHERAGQALDVDAFVLVETAILGGDHRLVHLRRDLGQLEVTPMLLVEHRQQGFPVGGVNVACLSHFGFGKPRRHAQERTGTMLEGDAGEQDYREHDQGHHQASGHTDP